LRCASDPTIPSFRPGARGYKKKEERIKSKKWEKRKIVHAQSADNVKKS
jgi:hypothetical protein